jgi:hypothetical protein
MADATQTPAPKPDATPEWVTVSEDEVDEVKFTFDALGEELIGEYLGTRNLGNENGTYTQYRFKLAGDVYAFVNGNYSLSQGMRPVRIGSMVRITWVDEKDTGQDSLMRIFRVDVARKSSPTAKAKGRSENT